MRLVAANADTNPSEWTWRVSFELYYEGERVPLDAFSFTVPEYIEGPDPEDPDTGSVGLVDLTLVSPVPASPGNAVVRGERGEGLQIDRQVATYGDLPATPPEGDGAQYVVVADRLLYVYRTGDGWMPNGQGVVIRGPQGDEGPIGDTGPANSLSIGTVTTGAPGSAASASITGTPPSQVLSMTIPRGDVGPAGSPPDATTTSKGIVQLAGVLAGTAAAPAFNAAAFGTTSSTACVGNDARLSDARTPTAAGQVYDVAFVAQTGTRTTGAGNVLPQGHKLDRPVRFNRVIYRGNTADASGSLVVELRKNGSQISGTNLTIAAADQTAGGANATASGTWDFAEGDILSVHVASVGSTPGTYLVANIKGVTL
ncbi:hypothetical protein [Nocardia amikacinitolerans]|uniref:hypothetical protein n=1 Tax=Nocardia amikacinitolerans TaxID=756689 RepID=UPI001180A522|nr:hypothetical protein [Nocardia amikacinitolerans]